jgi:methionyl-tRNA formyltransferase
MRLAFMGTPDFAVPVLVALIAAGHEIAAVYSQPARPKGRGMTQAPSPVAAFAVARGLTLRTPKTLRTPEAQVEFAALDLDAAVVVAYGLILPKPVLEAPRYGCFNLHGSLLPRWRGAAPIQRAVMAGDTETGVMVMRVDEGLDTGPVLMTERILVGRKTAGALFDEMAEKGAPLMVRAMADVAAAKAVETPQSVQDTCYARKIDKEEARIDWSRPAAEIDCLIRGLSPAPGAWCQIRGERLKILYAEPADGAGAPGTVLNGAPTVACGTGALRLVSMQRAGKAVVAAADFQRGFALKLGEVLR